MFDALLENIGKQSVVEAHTTVNDVIQKLGPLFQEIENRGGGILHGLLDRFEIDIHIKLNPIPKATAVNE